ncbi:hypothetical protein EJB05_06104 [Eragrostis curvula]|uniref:Knottin scorpion toxin-like domain-containing protein n=1 Tax=Eragrostis curvula TaxID=38414 RepID=A0A5J9WEU9_9POAL|nr:hypothetical protein EJB05_06104 [Eragrostis curvula]
MPNKKMNAKQATVLCLLLVLMLHADHASAVSTGTKCFYSKPWIPFCKAWSCKAECWMEAKGLFLGATVKEHKCIKGGFKGRCYCLMCNNP